MLHSCTVHIRGQRSFNTSRRRWEREREGARKSAKKIPNEAENSFVWSAILVWYAFLYLTKKKKTVSGCMLLLLLLLFLFVICLLVLSCIHTLSFSIRLFHIDALLCTVLCCCYDSFSVSEMQKKKYIRFKPASHSFHSLWLFALSITLPYGAQCFTSFTTIWNGVPHISRWE